MAPSKLRKAIGAVKDQTSISLAKVGSNSITDLDVAIVKATRHEEYPPDERYVREIINMTTYQRLYVNACVNTIARRLNKTKNWVVALKTLMLIHRLLLDGDIAFEQEIFFATRRGTRLLNLSDFRDASGKSNAWDYSAFVRTYALYLDEQLEFKMQSKRGKRSGYAYQVDDEQDGANTTPSNAIVVRTTPIRKMKNERIFSRVNHLMQLLERFLASKPDMVRVHEIFSRVSKQYDELDAFYAWCKTIGIARSSEYPEVEKISQKKLDMMDEYIHEKSVMLQSRRAPSTEPRPEPVQEPASEKEVEPEPDMNSIQALPPPEGFVEETEKKEAKEEEAQPKAEAKPQQEFGDFLNLGEDAPSTQEHGDKLALALFDGAPAAAAPTSTTTPWEAFKDSSSSGDWELALVQSASHLSNQNPTLPGGFDTLMLDGMYQQGATVHAMASSGVVATGSASSVALGSAGRPAMLALPAPPVPGGAATSSINSDPFAASLSVAPPPYVQMSEMEKKQSLLIQEQMMWQQYGRDGMQGQVGLAKVQQNPYQYNAGGYMRTY